MLAGLSDMEIRADQGNQKGVEHVVHQFSQDLSPLHMVTHCDFVVLCIVQRSKPVNAVYLASVSTGICFRIPASDLHIRDNAVKAHALKASAPDKGVNATHEQSPIMLAICSTPEQFFWPHLTNHSTGIGRHIDMLAC